MIINGTIFPEYLSPQPLLCQPLLKIGDGRFLTIMEVSIGFQFLRYQLQFAISKNQQEKPDGFSVGLMNDDSQVKRNEVEIDVDTWQQYVESTQQLGLHWQMINEPQPFD